MSSARGLRRLIPGRFRERLLIAMCVLVVGSQLVSAVAVSRTVREDAMARATSELEVGRRVFEAQLRARSTDLAESVRVLSADFGFKSAVATNDTATIASVLENHGARIGADLVVLVDNGGELVAATRGFSADDQSARPFPDLHQRAQRTGEATGVAVVGDRLVQLVVVPVRAPVPVAWVMMGFDIDAALAQEMKSLTTLDVSFVGRDGAGDLALASTLPQDARPALIEAQAAWDESTPPAPFFALGGDWLTALAPLPLVPPASGFAVLQMPESTVTAARRSLERQALVVLLLTLAAALVLGIGLARGIGLPLQRVVRAADAIRRGDYGQRVATRSGGEIGLLADAINAMQEGIADREAQIRHQASHDGLTGLPNRRFVEQALARRLAAQEPFAVLRVNLLGFRAINDALGHDVGDRVLCTMAERLRGTLRPDTEIARIGGDEFLAIVDRADASAAARRARQILAPLSASIDVDGSPVAVNIAIGVVASPEHGDDENRLLRRADIALGQAAEARDGVAIYVPGDDEQHLRELRLIRDLVGAIEGRALTMAFQPRVRTDDGVVVSAEALVRWTHPELGAIPPDEFVFLAERSGQIRALTDAVIEQVADEVARWRAAGRSLVAGINLSAHDLADDGFRDGLLATLARHELGPADVALEITESAVLQDAERAIEMLEALRADGFEIAVDDYGTGYSSLSQIRRLPVTELKIDKSFVLQLEDDLRDREIVRSTVALGHALGLRVIAEGLESQAAWQLLADYGCDELQGFGIARPMTADALPDWIDGWRPSGPGSAAA
jgi:diguanylate cyclase (GGDEF)-like protein